ncbi:AraC family transcriptional regulator [Paraburkholderia sp. Ac-20340]|uniref:AraC family transcriptional regulator n=1 Tax=Paraburkholderia sp. Ac-20340 TaxID=2703888 RepID=UPI00197D011B|nr:AraC family transcriptional regulator [Paraburkholderia sp. Ac-20340]MBN3856800.1 AraC family transcriptional regulator [Paraburkholderia sp. Ac-20340]
MNRHRPSASPDWVERAESIEGVERIEAFFHGKAYAMHRHDTYAIGRTLAGVQSFNYRRGQCNSLPGHTLVLHPDEPHDGQAGTGEGFQYRMIYVQPSLFQDVLGGRTLPFLEGGVTTDPRLSAATGALLQQMSYTLEPLEQNDALTELIHALADVTGTAKLRPTGDYRAARLARDFLHAHSTEAVALEALEGATGRDRWSLSRDFRQFYGTSPYRYLTMRRLDTVRRLLLAGTSLSQAAAAAGFADQPHMTRHFSKAFGMTPGQWLRVARG